jgi:hypothetical protein
MHGINPAPGQIGERVQVGLLGQHLGLEAAHLAGGGRSLLHRAATDHPAHGRIMRQPVGIVDVLIPGEATEDGLAELGCEGVAAVAARPGIGENLPGKFGQAESVIEFAEGEQTGVGGDSRAVEFQLQATVKSESKIGFCRFTRWVFHPRTPARQLSC